MKKEKKIYIVLWVIIAILSVLLVLTNHGKFENASSITKAPKRDGSGPDKSILVNVISKSEDYSANESEIQVREWELRSISEKYGERSKDWIIKLQSIDWDKDKTYDKYTILLSPQNEERTIFFDVSDAFLRQKPRVTYDNPVQFYYLANDKEDYYDSSKKTSCAQSDEEILSYYKYMDFDKDGVDEIYYNCFQGGSSNSALIYIYKLVKSEPTLIETFDTEGDHFAADKNNDGFLDIVTYIKDDDSQCEDKNNCSNAEMLPREVVYYWNNNKKNFSK